MKNKYKKCAETEIMLHNMLNSYTVPCNIDQLYKQLWERKQELYDNDDFFQNNDDSGYTSLHDGGVSNLSERKKLNRYHTTFTIDGMRYLKGVVDCVVHVEFDIISRNKFRSMSGRYIYDFSINTEEKIIVFIYLEKWAHLKCAMFEYDEISIVQRPVMEI